MKFRIFLIFVLLSAALLPAFEYEVKTVKVLPIESYPARATASGITIAVDPFVTNERSFTAFDVKNLNSNGYFPIHIIVRNDSTTFITFVTREIVLITSDAQQLYSTPAAVVVDDVFRSGISSRIPLIKAHDPSKSSRMGSPLDDFTNKDITNKVVDPGSVADGFLFFYNPEPKKNLFAGSTLYIPKVEEEGTHKRMGPFSIPLDPAMPKSK